MNLISRRSILSIAASGGLLTASGASTQTAVPQPERLGHGGTEPGPRNLERDRQNRDMLVPPSTDYGTLPNLRFSFSDAHMRLEPGGWTRQVTERELGVSKDIAGVNMRLNVGGVRELHWHKAAEWAYMLYGTARITAVDAQGRNFVDDVGVGDLWFFPAGIPHSIQGLNPDGCEFLLHWHPNTNEWQYYIEGQARMGVFGASGQARTFDFQAGDVGYVPFATGHYIENTGTTPMRFLEVFKSGAYADVSLHQWMALTPPELVEAHLHLGPEVMQALRKGKTPVVPA
jgi:oxalate decarboxylase/phosphoglucose isomerase-like protein (cupin superfamily)